MAMWASMPARRNVMEPARRRTAGGLSRRPAAKAAEASAQGPRVGGGGDIISSPHCFISSPGTFYLRVNGSKVVLLQSQPETEYSLPKLHVPLSDVADPPWSQTQGPHTGVRQHGRRARSRMRGKLKPEGQHAGDVPNELPNFLVCLSRHSGLPRWMLATCIFLSIMVMLWLSCASLVAAPEKHIKTQLSIVGDKAFWRDVHKFAPYHVIPMVPMTINQSDDTEGDGAPPSKGGLEQGHAMREHSAGPRLRRKSSVTIDLGIKEGLYQQINTG